VSTAIASTLTVIVVLASLCGQQVRDCHGQPTAQIALPTQALAQWVAQRNGGHYPAAITGLQALHREFPERRDIAIELAVTLAFAAKHKESIDILNQLCASNRQDSETAVLLGRVQTWSGDIAAARATLDTVLAANPHHTNALNALGALELATLNRTRAHDAYTAAIASDPDNQEAKTGIAHLYQAKRWQLQIENSTEIHSQRNYVSTQINYRWNPQLTILSQIGRSATSLQLYDAAAPPQYTMALGLRRMGQIVSGSALIEYMPQSRQVGGQVALEVKHGAWSTGTSLQMRQQSQLGSFFGAVTHRLIAVSAHGYIGHQSNTALTVATSMRLHGTATKTVAGYVSWERGADGDSGAGAQVAISPPRWPSLQTTAIWWPQKQQAWLTLAVGFSL
jgi:Flp pilus assembly protein TadD